MAARADVTFLAARIPADAVDFVLEIQAADLPAAWLAQCAADGGNVRFKTGDGLLDLPFEPDNLNPAAPSGSFRVRYAGVLSATADTTIQALIVDGATLPPPTDPNIGRNAVWIESEAVLHHDSDATDSTGNWTWAEVGVGFDYTTTPGAVVLTNDGQYESPNGILDPSPFASGYRFSADFQVAAGVDWPYMFKQSNNIWYWSRPGSVSDSVRIRQGATVNIPGWTQIEGQGRVQLDAVWDGVNVYLYKNGVELSRAANSDAPPNFSGPLYLWGNAVNNHTVWDTRMDTVARTQEWITTEQNNRDHATTPFYSVQEIGEGGAALSGSIAGSASVTANLARSPGLGAAVSGGASVAASLVGAALLTGALSAAAATDATLTAFPLVPAAELEASVAGSSSVQAQLLAADGLGGSLVGSSSVDAALTVYPGLSAQVAGAATAEGSLSVALSLSGVLAGTSYAVLESPTQWWWPRYKMTEDLSPIFELEEFAFDAVLNGALQFKCIFTAFYSEVIGGTVNMRGNEPMMMVEQTAVPGLKEGDVVTIESQDYTVRELQPSNTGLIRVALEWNG